MVDQTKLLSYQRYLSVLLQEILSFYFFHSILLSVKMQSLMIFCIPIKKITPLLTLWFVFIIVVIIWSLQFIHVLSIVQNVDVNRGNISVLDCKIIAVSSRIIIWKFVSVGIKSNHKTVTVRAILIKLIYGQLIWCTDYRFKANTCIICIVQFQNLGLRIVYCNRNIKVPVTFIFVVARICSIFFLVIF